ncbi:MAG: hypothetical protein EXS05_22095 [Planctomycetaceae bacterium]|nr:hypothetical protein [Planctomycetaceae bacterium]
MLVTASTLVPCVDPSDLVMQCRIDAPDEMQLMQEYITAAGQMVEIDAEIALLTSTWAVYLDRFPAWEIELRKVPVASITSIVYLDQNGTSQTLIANTDYVSDLKHSPSRVMPAYGKYWPITYWQENSVTVTFVAGLAAQNLVNPIAKQAIRLLVAHWFYNRGAVGTVGQEIEFAYTALVSRLKWAGSV